MYYGELNEKTEDFRKGHIIGGKRMGDFLISELEKEYDIVPNMVSFLKEKEKEWNFHCLTFGMGTSEPSL